MDINIKFAFFEKLESCGVFRLIDDFFSSEVFSSLANEAQPFRMNISPKGLTIISPDGEREYACQRFSEKHIPDMPSNLLRDFTGIVIEYCQEHHSEYEYRFAPRKLASDEINPAESRLMELAREVPSPMDSMQNSSSFGMHNRPGGDFSGSRPGAGSGNYRVYNRPGGDYSGPRTDGISSSRANPSHRPYTERPVSVDTATGYVIGVMKK